MKNTANFTCLYPHGFKNLMHPNVMVAGIIFCAMVIIPVSIIFEISQNALIAVVVFSALIFCTVMALLKPAVYMTVRGDLVTYNTCRFWGKNDVSFKISDIDKIMIQTDTAKVCFISIASEESGMVLMSMDGDEYFIDSSNFHNAADYKKIKKLLSE